MAIAAVAAGADGLLLDVGTPSRAGHETAIDVETFRRLMGEMRAVAAAVGRTM
jgi:3-deoxy-D-arabino-heptulosonate 7-phosphate (DAHP) synthase